MKILPSELNPPSEPTKHRHQPNPVVRDRGYQTFVSCLRWDFGFTCALCLLHEMDLFPRLGAAGTGLMSAEHHVPQSHDPTKRNEYSNCLYACRFCNRARHDKPVINDAGRRLLDPSRDAWGSHFILSEGKIHPRRGDDDAVYTHETYKIDEPVKVALRLFRMEFYADRLPLVQEAVGRIVKLLAKASECLHTDRELFFILLETAEDLRQRAEMACRELSWYAAIPPDAPSSCRCGDPRYQSLPPVLKQQMIDLPEFCRRSASASTTQR